MKEECLGFACALTSELDVSRIKSKMINVEYLSDNTKYKARCEARPIMTYMEIGDINI